MLLFLFTFLVVSNCFNIFLYGSVSKSVLSPYVHQVRPLNERLREVQVAKLVVDVVQCAQNAPQLKRVIQYVCGNSLVCETLKDARRIAFDGPERLQVSACHQITNILGQSY